jgi:ribosomal protein S18 acetylase RimI-like enzyme
VVQILPITPALVADYKQVRLRALQDSPLAFSSTFARESQLTEEDWMARATRLIGSRDVGYFALLNGSYAGLAIMLVDPVEHGDPYKGNLISMWVAPEARRCGVGRRLIEAIAFWAAGHEVKTLTLMVTDVNHTAIAFYESLGFAKTGQTEAYPNDPSITEYEMAKHLEH